MAVAAKGVTLRDVLYATPRSAPPCKPITYNKQIMQQIQNLTKNQELRSKSLHILIIFRQKMFLEIF